MRFNLIRFRKKMKLSQNGMADKLETSRPHYSNIENGKVNPSIEFAYKLQDVFKVNNVMELLKNENDITTNNQ